MLLCLFIFARITYSLLPNIRDSSSYNEIEKQRSQVKVVGNEVEINNKALYCHNFQLLPL